jgi:hypothetical protein
VWGLPYFLSLSTNTYTTKVFEKARMTKLPKSYAKLGEMYMGKCT